ncbi:hypothetical protein CYL31_15645 [Marinomonas sp. A3A]|uniref:CesT family type III secretion system chaperone n=1 Tax=Marinomonas TaxID=28253 RepID=UPI001BB404E6|nr:MULTISPECIES: CesT family type III secretion system chaperone [Marinomonas]QUX92749.1 hypothetical protein CYL31_15645 [Marinomonas sp. A3A]
MTNNLSKKLQHWLQHYHRDLTLNADGTCYLTVNSQLQILLMSSFNANTVHLYCPLMVLDSPSCHQLALSALTLNLYKDPSIQGVLGYDNTSEQLVYTFVLDERHYNNNMHEMQFRSALNDFIHNCQTLLESFEKTRHGNRLLPYNAIPTTHSTHSLMSE